MRGSIPTLRIKASEDGKWAMWRFGAQDKNEPRCLKTEDGPFRRVFGGPLNPKPGQGTRVPKAVAALGCLSGQGAGQKPKNRAAPVLFTGYKKYKGLSRLR